MSCKMLSIDSATKKTGIAKFINGNYQNVQLFDFSDIENIDDRFFKMSKAILDFLKTEKPDIIYMEEMVVLRNADTQRFLTRLQGIVYSYILYNNCDFKLVRPTWWRKYTDIKKLAEKQKNNPEFIKLSKGKKRLQREQLKYLSKLKVKELLDIDVNDDEAESILIGFAMINYFNEIEKQQKKKNTTL